MTVWRDKVLRFPADSTVEVLRALAADGVSISAQKGCQRAKVEPLFSAWRFAGVVRIAVALRAGA